MRVVTHRVAAGIFVLDLALVLPFWVVKGTEPSGHAALWVLYGAFVASAGIWVLTLQFWERVGRRAPLEPDRERHGFPAVEVQISGAGFDASVPLSPIFNLVGVRITNREKDRPVSLTFHVYARVKPVVQGDVGRVPLFPVDHPQAPALSMPIHVAPETSVRGDIDFKLQLAGGEFAEGGGEVFPIEVEDHLSGKRVALLQWRSAQVSLSDLPLNPQNEVG